VPGQAAWTAQGQMENFRTAARRHPRKTHTGAIVDLSDSGIRRNNSSHRLSAGLRLRLDIVSNDEFTVCSDLLPFPNPITSDPKTRFRSGVRSGLVRYVLAAPSKARSCPQDVIAQQ
jgi:hypothetical protein